MMMNWRKSTYSEAANCIEAASWRKSTYSQGASNCIECASVKAVSFRKSSHSSNTGQCVEAGQGAGVIIRDTMDRTGPQLELSPGAWTAFLATLK